MNNKLSSNVLSLMIMALNTDILRDMLNQKGEDVLSTSMKKPVLLVFLRHFGCVFCKEAMNDLSLRQEEIRNNGFVLNFVHMAENEVAEKYFQDFNLSGVSHISDPNKKYYNSFGLRKGSVNQLYGLKTWFRGFAAETKNYKLELSKSLGDSTQMPGIFTIYKGIVEDSYVHKYAADKVDYLKLLECCSVQ